MVTSKSVNVCLLLKAASMKISPEEQLLQPTIMTVTTSTIVYFIDSNTHFSHFNISEIRMHLTINGILAFYHMISVIGTVPFFLVVHKILMC